MGQGDEVNNSSWEGMLVEVEEGVGHRFSIPTLPGWYKQDTGLALAWEALSTLRSQQVSCAQGCLLRSEWADARGAFPLCWAAQIAISFVQ